jgi:hypothetical protein
MDEEGMQNKLLTPDCAGWTRERHARSCKRTALAITRCFSSTGPALKLDAGSHQF